MREAAKEALEAIYETTPPGGGGAWMYWWHGGGFGLISVVQR